MKYELLVYLIRKQCNEGLIGVLVILNSIFLHLLYTLAANRVGNKSRTLLVVLFMGSRHQSIS